MLEIREYVLKADCAIFLEVLGVEVDLFVVLVVPWQKSFRDEELGAVSSLQAHQQHLKITRKVPTKQRVKT